MKRIALTRGKYALVDDCDFDELSKFKWQFNSGYASRKIWRNGKSANVYMHRILLNFPSGIEIDHINGDKLDNRRGNLRLATRLQNIGNNGIRRDNTSGVRGVSWMSSLNKWRAYIAKNGKQIHLGIFERKEEAKRAYNLAALQYFGEFAIKQ